MDASTSGAPSRSCHPDPAIPILNVGPVNDKTDEKTDRIGDDVALAPLDPFSGIIAANPAAFSGFYALAVNHTRCRAGRTPDAQTRHLDQTLVDFAQQAVAAPVIEIASHCRDGREVMGQHPPLAPGRCDVEDRVKHIPQIHRPRSANSTPRRKQRRNQRPFPVARVTCVSAPAALILRACEFSPSHCDPLFSFATEQNHNPLNSLNSFRIGHLESDSICVE